MDISMEAVPSSDSGAKLKAASPYESVSFINYMHPRHFRDQKKRKKVRSFVASTSRRKSRQAGSERDGPDEEHALQTQLESKSNALNCALPARSASKCAQLSASNISAQGMTIARYAAGPRNDPFNSFPIAANGCVPHAVDVYKANPV